VAAEAAARTGLRPQERKTCRSPGNAQEDGAKAKQTKSAKKVPAKKAVKAAKKKATPKKKARA
jgi:hypothetical protein